MNTASVALLVEGLKIIAVGMAWVFAGLASVWALVAILQRLFPEQVAPTPSTAGARAKGATAQDGANTESDAHTIERAQVATIVAAALLSGALPIRAEAPVGPEFEDGRTAPNWVTGNRARVLHSWQPPRQKAN